ncbi:MAG TPA: bifunctional 4-hydroxy-2-oxoglutarate aldolase/2-dehydro-3-deoxy-phosphogluconate aldolase [Elusimicrobiota bacterium]|nr:bifunctional 4-hydroxy-2-oxoglutarate aldolase/2-dehydro-3-deoxy-phosphogluconate aldolase [Elusimicrobiota bacterium]
MKQPWPRENAVAWTKQQKYFAVIRHVSSQTARGAIEALIKGGFKLVEIDATVLGVLDIVKEYSRRPGFMIGVGALYSQRAAADALKAGAHFLGTLHMDPALIRLAHRHKTMISVGGLTPTEIVAGWTEGADLIKVVPSGPLGGPDYIKMLRSFFPEIPLMPSGDVTLGNIKNYFLAGATAVGLGEGLLSESHLTEGRWQEITLQAKRFQDILRKY